MVYSYKMGFNDDFKRRYGMVLNEEQIRNSKLPNGNVLNAFEAIAVVVDKTNLIEEIDSAKKRNISNDKYYWRAVVMMDEDLKNWKITVKEEEVKPSLVCQGQVISSTLELKDYRCFNGKI